MSPDSFSSRAAFPTVLYSDIYIVYIRSIRNNSKGAAQASYLIPF